MKNKTDTIQFIHRDLSWLAFNERVLEEAEDQSNPLLERLKFMAIFINNLDEFYMVRVAGIKNLIDSNYQHRDRYGYYPQEILDSIELRVRSLLQRLYKIFEKQTLRELTKENIHLKMYDDLDEKQKKYVSKYFKTTLFPILTPMAVDPGHPFPVLPSKSNSIAVTLKAKNKQLLAIIPVPRIVNRLLRLPSDANESAFMFIDDIIKHHLKVLFKGYQIKDVGFFRLMRDSDYAIEEEFAPDLLKAIEEQVRKRMFSKPVFVEMENGASDTLRELLCQRLDFDASEVIRIGAKIDLTFLFELLGQVDREDLCFSSFTPACLQYQDIFQKISKGDFLVHMPYQAFDPTVDFIQSASMDENVLAIKVTLYRTNRDSAIISALKQAAKNKKQVTVLVEIKARFDEEQNINWARELERSGCHVIYGIPGLKIHSKMTLIVRKEEGQIKRYVHLSTGNYNEKTAKVYTDIGYFTMNEDVASDISDVFNVITGYSIPTTRKRVVSAPNDLRLYFMSLIDREITCQKKKKNGFIFVKINSLEDTDMIDKLYEASQAGVKIWLLVRGICCLVPGQSGLSENIEVRSIVGRFLEHTRIYYFGNDQSPRVFLSSADWMRRNLDRRIELLFEIFDEKNKTHLRQVLDIYWQEKLKSRIMMPTGEYDRMIKKDKNGLEDIHQRMLCFYEKIKK